MEDKTPFELGYSMPAEWEEHEGTWISWPKNEDSFPDEILPEVEKTYIEIINALHRNEKVNLLIDDEETEKRVMGLMKSRGISGNVLFHRIRTVDVWFRDYGPIFVKKDTGEIAAIHWGFNAWGGKYDDLKEDCHVPEKIPIEKIPLIEAPMVLEGGSIDVNGEGTLLTTEQCLLNKNRNPGLTREEIEKNLKDYLGAINVLWLKEGIAGDDTDGHIDDLARFVDKSTVVCAYEENVDDENYDALKQNIELLTLSRDQDGRKLNVIRLPMPKPLIYDGQRLPTSYANFYIGNRVILVPTFKDPNDKKAMEILQNAFPWRKIVGINCRELVYGFGTIHCASQQQPRTGYV